MINDKTQTAAIVRRDAFEPSDMDQAMELAKALGNGGLLSPELKSPNAVVTVMLTGRELGLSVMQSMRGIHIIKGRPSLSADLMVGLVKQSDLCEYFQLVESTSEIATYETKRREEPKPTKMSFTAADAKRAGLTSPNWRSYPAAMMRARCSSALARAVYPDVVGGLLDHEENDAIEGGVERDVTPKAPAKPMEARVFETESPKVPTPRKPKTAKPAPVKTAVVVEPEPAQTDELSAAMIASLADVTTEAALGEWFASFRDANSKGEVPTATYRSAYRAYEQRKAELSKPIAPAKPERGVCSECSGAGHRHANGCSQDIGF